jgi:glycerol-3-phosphate acyltransferase PlsX
MMGGDFAPLEAVKGIQQLIAEADKTIHLVLFGDQEQITPHLSAHSIPEERFTIVHAPQVIDMHEHPTKALKEKRESSIAIGFHMLATSKIDAFISAGNTGAMLVGALYSLKPVEGVLRPTISTIIPKEDGSTGLLLDVGLNSDCKPEHLNQFAVMGAVYAQQILGVSSPRVALLNIGEEEGKGNLLAQAAYSILKENKNIDFVGNVEGRDVFMNKSDVIVCDGFTGNIILKMAESFYDITQRQDIRNGYFDRFNFENYGGTPVLGISKPVIIGHGISKGLAFKNMILLAQKMIATNLLEKLQAELSA